MATSFEYRYDLDGEEIGVRRNLNVASERSHLAAPGGPSTKTYQAPNISTSEPRIDVLCRYCDKLAKESKIVHQPAKINWLGDEPVNIILDDVHYEPETGIPKYETFPHHNTLAALRKSAQTCQLCVLLCAYDAEHPDLSSESLGHLRYTLKVLRADNHMMGPAVLKLDVRGKESGVIYLMDGQPKPKQQNTLKFSRTDHYEVFCLAESWLKSCLKEHDSCNHYSVDNWTLPTRLIKITGFWSKVYSLQLCLGKDLPSRTPYLTLSHCWGGAHDILKLTGSSLGPLQNDIPLANLPKNFKEAAEITLNLGYEYLWIDSLCIIQDSGEDWKCEAANMGNVYRNSVCTIAAMGAENPHGGCYMTRDARSFSPCQLFPNSGERTGVYADNWRVQDLDPHTTTIPTLHTRGWVVQERTLSPRTIYYGREMVYWECASMAASEENPELKTVSPGFSLKRTFFGLLDNTKYGPRSRYWAESWWYIIRAYTRCDLSFASDRWAAIAGVLNIIEQQCGSRLIYGLWEITLPEELLWEVIKPRKEERLENDTPSWSWLSLEAEVYKMWFNLDKYFRMDAIITRSNQPGDDTKLHIRARMCKFKWSISYRGDGKKVYNFRLFDDFRSAIGTWDGVWSPDLIPNRDWDTWTLQFVTDDKAMEAAGLVVIPAAGQGSKTWVRVGIYTLMPSEDPEDTELDSAWNLGDVREITLL